jgi:hypothetical protein
MRSPRVVGTRTRLCSLAILLVLLALQPLAESGLTDPLWVAGVYDAADADDAILLVTSMAGQVEGNLHLARIPYFLSSAFSSSWPVNATAVPRRLQARAPPKS